MYGKSFCITYLRGVSKCYNTNAQKEGRTNMAEGMQPHHYDRQVQDSEAYRMNMERLEKHGEHQHQVNPKPISKIRRVLLAVLAILLIALLIYASANVCLAPVPL